MTDKIRLTQFATKSGCAAKIGPCDLRALLSSMPRATGEFARLLETHDDAAVTWMSDDLCLVQTVDFFTPIVDDPYWFGQIAAANALSDIYAMGARPLTAMNLVAWPVDIGLEPLADVLCGGAEKVAEAGAELAGGHSIDDKEAKYGLAVTGVATRRDRLQRRGRSGDKLVLTKRLGIGVLATALKRGHQRGVDDGCRAEAAGLNAAAPRPWLASESTPAPTSPASASPATWARCSTPAKLRRAAASRAVSRAASRASLPSSTWTALPLHERVLGFIASGTFAHGLRANRDYLLPRFVGAGRSGGGLSDADLSDAEHSDPRVLALFDPQTSGGLLLAVAEDRHERLTAELATARRPRLHDRRGGGWAGRLHGGRRPARVSGRPDDGSSLRQRPELPPSAHQDLAFGGGWLLRVFSVVPFVMIGALAAAAAVVLPLLLIIGPGLDPIWRVARGRSAAWYVVSLAEFVGLELVPLATLRLSILATTHGVKQRPKAWFFPLVLAVALAGVVALVVLKVDTPASLARAGLSTTRWLVVTLGVVGCTAVLAALRVRQARGV